MNTLQKLKEKIEIRRSSIILIALFSYILGTIVMILKAGL